MLGPLLLAVAAVVVAAVAILAATGRLHRNSVAGIRIPSLSASEDAWKKGHRAAVLPTAVGAVICIVIAMVAAASPQVSLLGTTLETVVLIFSVLAATVRAGRAARR